MTGRIQTLHTRLKRFAIRKRMDSNKYSIFSQGKFKREIKGPIYLAMELPQEEKYKVTGPMKLVIKACLSLMKAMGHKDVHLSYGGSGEVPHMGAPAFHSFDRVVVTPPGETPPPLGHHLPRMPSDVQRRKHFFKLKQKVEVGSTYTFSMKNRRFNPLKWKVVGVPIARQFTVSRFTESVRLAVYEVLEENEKPVEDPKGDVTAMAKKKHRDKNVEQQARREHGKQCVQERSTTGTIFTKTIAVDKIGGTLQT